MLSCRSVTAELSTTLIVLAAMLALFVSNRLRLDLVALLGLLALVIGGAVSVDQALAGFADPVVLMIAALFVVGAALFQTGVADALGLRVERMAGDGVTAITAVIMLVTALLSAFLSSTGTVAVMLPVVLAIARRRRISPSLLLMPMAFAALLGGMLTLIGTPPNLIVSGQLEQAGLESFGFFAFTAPGLIMLAVGMIGILLLGPRLLPERRCAEGLDAGPSWCDLFDQYGLNDNLVELHVPAHSELASTNLTSTELRSRHGLTVLAIASRTARGEFLRKAEPGSLIRPGDRLFAVASPDALEAVCRQFALDLRQAQAELPKALQLVDVLVPPRSPYLGRSLRELRLHSGAGVTVLAQRVPGSPPGPAELDRPLAAGDGLLLTGDVKAIRRVARSPRDLVLLAGDDAETILDPRKAPLALGILALMMLSMTFGWLANVISVLCAAVLLVLCRCLSMTEAYRSINFESVVMIAAILPMATALEQAGGMALAADWLMGATATAGPILLLGVLFLFTAGLSQLVSNTATTVLVAPIALQAALGIGIQPQAALMTVAIAASSAFITPMASPVNTLVLGPGGYRFGDFARLGIPLQLMLLLSTLLVVPWLFPL